MLYIGIDLGTSAVKLLLMDGEGQIKKIVSKEYPIYFPHPGWSEQKPEDWFAGTMDGLKELLDGCDKEQVAGISFGGQMHGLVILDEEDRVIRPALLWNDGRTWEECDYLNNVIGKEKLSEYTANTVRIRTAALNADHTVIVSQIDAKTVLVPLNVHHYYLCLVEFRVSRLRIHLFEDAVWHAHYCCCRTLFERNLVQGELLGMGYVLLRSHTWIVWSRCRCGRGGLRGGGRVPRHRNALPLRL